MLFRNLLLAAILLFAGSCALLKPAPVQNTLQNARPAVTHILYGNRSCSAFHIGDGEFITAAHCFGKDLGYTMKEIRMIDYREFNYFPVVKAYDFEKDLVLLSVYGFKGPALHLWDGNIPYGMELVVLGYPGYYDVNFLWEHGYVKDIVEFDGIEMILSEESSYAGESGGPVISTVDGRVIGMVDAGMELIEWLRMPMHSHISLSLFVSATEIRAFLTR